MSPRVRVGPPIFETAEECASWVINTALGLGAGVHTALWVAAHFMSDPLIRDRFEPGWREAEARALADRADRAGWSAKTRRSRGLG